MKKVRVEFKCRKSSKTSHLDFQIHQHRFADKWLKALDRVNQQDCSIRDNGVFYGPGLNNRSVLLERLNTAINYINDSSGYRIEMRPFLEMNQTFLNGLHSEFERLGGMPNLSPQVVQALSDINYCVHKYEVFVREPGVENSPHFLVDVNFLDSEKIDLVEEDYDYFTVDREFGEIYLNYATIGVPPLSAFWNKDNRPPVPQRTFQADFSLNFYPDNRFTQWQQLKHWLKTAYGLDAGNPKLALGYISLGNMADCLDSHQVFELVKNHPSISSVSILDG